MRQILVILIAFIMTPNIKCQVLSIQEVCDILSALATRDIQEQLSEYDGEIEIRYSTVRSNIKIDYCWTGNVDVTFNNDVTDICNSLVLDLNKVSEINKIKSEDSRYIVQVHCESGLKDCVNLERDEIINYYYNLMHDNPDSRNHYDFINIFYFLNYETQELIYNGIRYLAYELNEAKAHRQRSARNFNYSEGGAVVKVDLGEYGGVSVLPINMGGIKRMAILDSGASDVSIPESVESQLLANGIITENDYMPSGLYRVADGRTLVSRRFIIPKIEIEGVTVQNVACSVNETDDILLLGKAFLDVFKSWSIDNETNQLILKY